MVTYCGQCLILSDMQSILKFDRLLISLQQSISSFCSSTLLYIGPVTTIRCNDTIIGDPLYEVPVIIDEDGSKLSLCYEVLGGPNQNFNLISDTCVSVNALYSPMIIPSNGNFISKIGVLAEDNNGTCQQIEVDLEGCTARVGGQVVTMYNQNGVSVTRRTNRVRIAVPNCENTDLVMWVICEVRRGQPMIKFVVARGFSLRPTSHGLIGKCIVSRCLSNDDMHHLEIKWELILVDCDNESNLPIFQTTSSYMISNMWLAQLPK